MALEEAMQRANQRGTLQVIAAGNTGSDNDGPAEMATYPAAFDTEIILSVAAIGSDGRYVFAFRLDEWYKRDIPF